MPRDNAQRFSSWSPQPRVLGYCVGDDRIQGTVTGETPTWVGIRIPKDPAQGLTGTSCSRCHLARVLQNPAPQP